jgi:hypothetical protein
MSPTDYEEEDLRQLAELYQAHPPQAPSEEAWAKVLEGIHRALPARPAAPPAGAGWWGPLMGVALVAASVAVAVFFPPPPRPEVEKPGPLVRVEEEGPFAVASAAEIFILHADPNDADLIALGQPMMGAFEVASSGEVNLDWAPQNPDGVTAPRLLKDSQMAMIVNTGDDEPE